MTSACSITGDFVDVGVVEAGADFVDVGEVDLDLELGLDLDLDLDWVFDLLGVEDGEGEGESSLEGLLIDQRTRKKPTRKQRDQLHNRQDLSPPLLLQRLTQKPYPTHYHSSQTLQHPNRRSNPR